MGKIDDEVLNPTPGLLPAEDRTGHRVCRYLYLLRGAVRDRGTPWRTREVLTRGAERRFGRDELVLGLMVRFCGQVLVDPLWSADEVLRRLVEDVCDCDPRREPGWAEKGRKS